MQLAVQRYAMAQLYTCVSFVLSDQQEFAAIRHPLPSTGKRPQYVIRMNAINAMRESET